MKINSAKITLFVLGILLAGAVGASAFTDTSTAPTAGNTDFPINISNLDQVKVGGLSVNAFHARGNALFMQDAVFNGTVRGGLPTDATSTLKIDTDAKVTGTVHAKQFLNAKTIAHTNDASEKPLCANDQGVIVTCESLANTGGGGGGGSPSNPPAVAYVDAQPMYTRDQPNPDAVICTATLSSPAESGGATVEVRYQYQNDFGMTVMGSCPTITIATGANGGSTVNPEPFDGTSPLVSSCVVDASIPVDPSIHC